MMEADSEIARIKFDATVLLNIVSLYNDLKDGQPGENGRHNKGHERCFA